MKRFSIFKQGYHNVNPSTVAVNVDASVIEDQSVSVADLIQGQWIAVLYDEQWWPGEVVNVKYLNDVPNYEIKHQFKPVSDNKFTYMPKPQTEVIVGQTYLAILPGAPEPVDRRFLGYDPETVKLVSLAKMSALR